MEDKNLCRSTLYMREDFKQDGNSILWHQWLHSSPSYSVYAHLRRTVHSVHLTPKTLVLNDELTTKGRIDFMQKTERSIPKYRRNDHSGIILPFGVYKYLRRGINSIGLPSCYAENKTSDSGGKTPEELSVKEGKGDNGGRKTEGEESRKEFRLNEEVRDEEVEEYLQTETGMDRLKRMYFRDPVTHKRGMDLQRLTTPLVQIFMLGGFFATLLRLPVARHEFHQKNQLVKYHAHDTHRAVRAKYDHIIMDVIRTGFFYGGGLAAFVGTMLLSAKTISVYRNKTGMLDFTLGGAVAGALFRLYIGPKAMIVGGALMGIGGTCMGTVLYFIQQRSGYTQDKIHFEDVRTLMEQGSILRPHLQRMKDRRD